jgi:uncharacterized delta-60 repeat protein
MKKRIWIEISSILVIVSLLIISGGGHDLGPAEKWVARYNGPGNNEDYAMAIAVDGSGNVYVTGHSQGSDNDYGFATVKYSTSGKRLWVRRYDGQGKDHYFAKAIAVDGSGNVYITGENATIKYNTNGKLLWARSENAKAIAVDGSGNVYITGGANGDYSTIKYDTNGTLLWGKTYKGPGNRTDYALAIAVDKSGNVYVTGQSLGSGSDNDYDYVTIKYNTNGTLLWTKRYNGPGNGFDSANAIAVDGSGNVYVTGESVSSNHHKEYLTIKYNTNGKRLWAKRYDRPGFSDDSANAIAVDGSGNVYITGGSRGSDFEDDYATIKYSPNGNQLWVQRYSGPGNEPGSRWDGANSIAVDSSGNVYITGASQGADSDFDYATIKYNTNGTLLWTKRYNGPGSGYDSAAAIAVDSSGNVYITGGSQGSGSNYDYATIKY